MKKLLLLLAFLVLSLSTARAQIVVSFATNSTKTIESKAEEIAIPIHLEGSWPDSLSSFKIYIDIAGDAVENAKSVDYKINRKEFEIKKEELITPQIIIKIEKDAKYDDGEYIELTLRTDNEDAGKVDESKKSHTIFIEDDNPSHLDIIMKRINSDADTSEIVGRLKLINSKVQLYDTKKSNTSQVPQEKLAQLKSMLSQFNINSDQVISDVQESQSTRQVMQSLKVNDNNKESTKLIPIDSVKVSFLEGVIHELNVFSYNEATGKVDMYSNIVNKRLLPGNKSQAALNLKPLKKSRNDRFPISVRHQPYREEIDDLPLFNVYSNRSTYIRFGDVLRYTTELGRSYPPSDIDSIKLTPKRTEKVITNNTALANYVNLNIYTDFLTLIKAQEGNGLVQSEASARIYTNTLNYNKRRFRFLMNFIEPNIRVSRFDENFDSVTPETDSTIDRMLLTQRSYLVTGLKVNLLKALTKFYGTFEINGSYNVHWSKIRGEMISNDLNEAPRYRMEPVNMYSWGLEVRRTVPQYYNFGLTASAGFYAQKLMNRDMAFIKNSDWQYYVVPDVELFYFPISNKANKIFLRLRAFLTQKDEGTNFLQMQVGYKTQFKLKAKTK